MSLQPIQTKTYVFSPFVEYILTKRPQLSGYIMPMIYGSECQAFFEAADTAYQRLLAFEIRRQIIKNVSVLLYLISRRSRYRAGTRYFRRGIDEDGNVANFNETEQFAFVDNPGSGEEQKPPHILSYVQTRGSIPLYWAEINTLRYKPDLQIMEGEERVCWLALVALFFSSNALVNSWPQRRST